MEAAFAGLRGAPKLRNIQKNLGMAADEALA